MNTGQLPSVQFLTEKYPAVHGTTVMRCLQPMQYLGRGYRTRVGNIYTQPVLEADVCVLHRLRLDEVTRPALEMLLAEGTVLVYDTDDLTFVDGHRRPGAARKAREAMSLCSLVTVSTDLLLEEARALWPDVRVVRNGLSHAYLDQAQAVFEANRSMRRDGIRIGYFSGSPHHDQDLASILEPLSQVLDANPSVRLDLAGRIRIPEALKRFGARVALMPFVPYDRFAALHAGMDINIVPLAMDSPVSLARSELKYMEAGACGVVTLAAPSGAYRHAIRPMENGLLAATRDEWRESLQFLIDHPAQRSRMGQAARDHVLDAYGPGRRSQEWDQLMQEMTGRRRARRPRSIVAALRLALARRRYALLRRLRRQMNQEED